MYLEKVTAAAFTKYLRKMQVQKLMAAWEGNVTMMTSDVLYKMILNVGGMWLRCAFACILRITSLAGESENILKIINVRNSYFFFVNARYFVCRRHIAFLTNGLCILLMYIKCNAHRQDTIHYLHICANIANSEAAFIRRCEENPFDFISFCVCRFLLCRLVVLAEYTIFVATLLMVVNAISFQFNVLGLFLFISLFFSSLVCTFCTKELTKAISVRMQAAY